MLSTVRIYIPFGFCALSVTKASAWYFRGVFFEHEKEAVYMLEKYQVENQREDQKDQQQEKMTKERY